MNRPRIASPSHWSGPRLAAVLFALSTLTSTAGKAEVHLFDTFSRQPSLAIPDGDLLGISDTRTVESPLSRVAGLEVDLTISGGFNGDLYAYLRHDTGFAVLLNRPGRSVALPFGYPDAGLSVTLADGVPNGDIHTYRETAVPPAGTPLTGRWQPDGREITPIDSLTSFDTATPTALLNSFENLDPRGVWTLFLADVSSGASHQLEGWSLRFVGVPVPDRTPTLGMTTVVLLALGLHRRSCR